MGYEGTAIIDTGASMQFAEVDEVVGLKTPEERVGDG